MFEVSFTFSTGKVEDPAALRPDLLEDGQLRRLSSSMLLEHKGDDGVGGNEFCKQVWTSNKVSKHYHN